MAKVNPVVVTDIKSLEKAATKKSKVIIVTNKQLFEKIKKKVDKDVKFSTNTGKALGISALVTVGSTIGTLAFPILAIPAALGYYSMVGSTWAKLSSVLVSKLRAYSWIESEDKSRLILLRQRGDNKFDEKEDTINLDDIETL